MKETKEFLCHRCGKIFEAQRMTDAHHKFHYCSSECAKLSSRKVANRPSGEEVIRMVNEGMSYVEIGKKFGVSDNAVRKWVKWDGLENVKIMGETKQVNCKNCKKAISKWACQRKTENLFCARECQVDWQRKNGPLGEYSVEDLIDLVRDNGLRGTARLLGVTHGTIAKKIRTHNPKT